MRDQRTAERGLRPVLVLALVAVLLASSRPGDRSALGIAANVFVGLGLLFAILAMVIPRVLPRGGPRNTGAGPL
jgi:hypothetical protein